MLHYVCKYNCVENSKQCDSVVLIFLNHNGLRGWAISSSQL